MMARIGALVLSVVFGVSCDDGSRDAARQMLPVPTTHPTTPLPEEGTLCDQHGCRVASMPEAPTYAAVAWDARNDAYLIAWTSPTCAACVTAVAHARYVDTTERRVFPDVVLHGGAVLPIAGISVACTPHACAVATLIGTEPVYRSLDTVVAMDRMDAPALTTVLAQIHGQKIDRAAWERPDATWWKRVAIVESGSQYFTAVYRHVHPERAPWFAVHRIEIAAASASDGEILTDPATAFDPPLALDAVGTSTVLAWVERAWCGESGDFEDAEDGESCGAAVIEWRTDSEVTRARIPPEVLPVPSDGMVRSFDLACVSADTCILAWASTETAGTVIGVVTMRLESSVVTFTRRWHERSDFDVVRIALTCAADAECIIAVRSASGSIMYGDLPTREEAIPWSELSASASGSAAVLEIGAAPDWADLLWTRSEDMGDPAHAYAVLTLTTVAHR